MRGSRQLPWSYAAKAAALAGLVLGVLALAGPAAAAPETTTYRYGPVEIGPYEVLQQDLAYGLPKPAVDGYITHMAVDVVDADGTPVPINRLMLHHIVFVNLGPTIGSKRDSTCGTFTAFDSSTAIPALGERFYAAGEERAQLRLPDGYGYPTQTEDQWALTAMLMNHRDRTDSAYIQYTVTTDTAPHTPVTPYWLDVVNCLADPVYDVPGGRPGGATHRRSFSWKPPVDGRIVAGLGHVHGGARDLSLRRAGGCEIYASKPTWGLPGHPFYNVKPVLHEPGPIDMSGFTSELGFPVRRGEALRLDSDYDGARLHARVMGIMVVFLAAGPGGHTDRCAPPPDLREWRTDEPGRTVAPRFRVPLTGLTRRGRARRIAAPPGKRVRVRAGARLKVGDRYFAQPNVSVARGSWLNWRFASNELHNVTVANGPRGFSSVNLDAGRIFRHRLRQPGTYRIFCALHPVEMTQTVRVRKSSAAPVRGRRR